MVWCRGMSYPLEELIKSWGGVILLKTNKTRLRGYPVKLEKKKCQDPAFRADGKSRSAHSQAPRVQSLWPRGIKWKEFLKT